MGWRKLNRKVEGAQTLFFEAGWSLVVVALEGCGCRLRRFSHKKKRLQGFQRGRGLKMKKVWVCASNKFVRASCFQVLQNCSSCNLIHLNLLVRSTWHTVATGFIPILSIVAWQCNCPFHPPPGPSSTPALHSNDRKPVHNNPNVVCLAAQKRPYASSCRTRSFHHNGRG